MYHKKPQPLPKQRQLLHTFWAREYWNVTELSTPRRFVIVKAQMLIRNQFGFVDPIGALSVPRKTACWGMRKSLRFAEGPYVFLKEDVLSTYLQTPVADAGLCSSHYSIKKLLFKK